MGHYIAKCKHGVVMGQCRCASPNKSVRIVECKHQEFSPPTGQRYVSGITAGGVRYTLPFSPLR